MDYKNRYSKWLTDEYFGEDTRNELAAIKDDEKEIEDRFFKDLEFGTGGLRGVIGAGTNRMNKYTIRRSTQGLANYLLQKFSDAKERGVAIACDSRHKSDEFARETALVLNSNGIKAYLFDDIRTTPELSFTVRELNCVAGVVITASHNPPQYNGYKVYGEDGCQLNLEDSEKIIDEVSRIEISEIKVQTNPDNNLLHIIGEEIDSKYINRVKGLVLRKDELAKIAKDLRVVYTPLHGTGNMPVRRVLADLGFVNVFGVAEQEVPDPNFSTVKSPNPEEREAFTLAIDLAAKVNADIIIGTDPDCDRVGVVVKNNNNEYVAFTGNQTGALLVDYVLRSMKEQNKLTQNEVVVKTIVTGELGAVIAKSYGAEVINVLTGFKFIGEKIREMETTDKNFVFGYEESYGYLAGTFVRDKDAVIASTLACEMAAYYKSLGMTLADALEKLYEKHGYYKEDLQSITLKGKDGMEKIDQILNNFRQDTPKTIGGMEVKVARDYEEGIAKYLADNHTEKLTLPKSNVLHFTLADNSWFCLRPSGTEPKIKIYFSVNGKDKADVDTKLDKIKADVMQLVNV